jgi:EF-hand domain pair
MKHLRVVVLVGLVTVFCIVSFAFVQGCGQDQGGQSAAPMMGCQQRFDAMDTNKDGQVSKDEFLATPHQRDNPEEMFKAMDVNKRGYLTKDEFCSGKGMGMGQGMGKGMGQGQGTGAKQ